MWFTETPWPPIFICCVIAAVLGIVWFSTQRLKYLFFAIGFVVLAGLIYPLERMIVTEAERIEADVFTLTSAFQQKDLEKTLSFFSEENLGDRLLVTTAMATVTVQDDLRVSDVNVKMNDDETEATSHFRANASVSTKEFGEVGWRPTRWEFTWRKEGDQWRIIKTRRLNPVRNEEMDPLEQRVE